MLNRKARENDTETFMVDEAAKMGGIAIKIRFVAKVGAPDRLVILPGLLRANIGFAELKHPMGSGRTSPQQSYWHKLLKGLGVFVEVVATRPQVLSFLERLSKL